MLNVSLHDLVFQPRGEHKSNMKSPRSRFDHLDCLHRRDATPLHRDKTHCALFKKITSLFMDVRSFRDMIAAVRQEGGIQRPNLFPLNDIYSILL